MRVLEIQFRGKRKDNGQWVYGDLTRYSEDMSLITVDLLEDEVYEVSTSTVGQFTGLHDKKGKEVYEDDVIAPWPGTKNNSYVVMGPSGVGSRYADGMWAGQLHHRPFEIEVLGNRYDNPELL